jgi:hypothetical protein
MSSDQPSIDLKTAIIQDDVNETDGKFTCPICYDYSSDSISNVKRHISNSRDDKHEFNHGENWASEIEDSTIGDNV